MAYKRPANPNTAYGRKRMREESLARYNALSPEEKSKHDETSTIAYIVILAVVMLIVFLVSGPAGLLKWLSH